METTSLRTFIGSVVCIDLVGYSKLAVDRQIAIKERFNRRLVKALARMPAADRVILDTGDGALIGFLGDPAQCFETTLAIRDAMNAAARELGAAEGSRPVRIGVHLGPVKISPGLSGSARLVGDGINIAERLVGFAQPGQIVVSRAFHDVVARLSDRHATLFRAEGARTDKVGQVHEIFSVAEAPPLPRRPAHVAIAAGGVAAILAIGGLVGWLMARRPAPPTESPAVTAKVETASPAAVPQREPAEAQQPVRTDPAQAARSETAPRSEPRRAPRPDPPGEPAAAPRQAPDIVGDAQRMLSTLGTGARDTARSVGSAAESVISTVTNQAIPRAKPVAEPVVISRAATFFPADAISQGIHRGSVRARLAIDAAGNVTRVTILSAEPPGYFEREATRSFRQWRFDAGAAGRTYEADLDFLR